MSTSPESELDLDLHFLPAWAQQPSSANRYAKYEGKATDVGRTRDDRKPQGDRRREQAPRGGTALGRGPRARSDRPGERRPEGNRGREQSRFPARESLPPAVSLPEVRVSLFPEEKGVESLARQIKLTGRAYPLFDIASVVLKRPERFHVRLNVVKNAAGQVVQPLWVCNLDETVWLSEQDAADHVLRRHFSTFYQIEKIPTEAPKGTYTFVAQCGLSGVILGPPNYHDYQNKLRKLHTDRFSRMAFDSFKSRVKIVRDEAVVKQWLEDQSWKVEYICLNLPEANRLTSYEEVGAHFRQTHLANIIKMVDSLDSSGANANNLFCPPLQALVRRAWDDQRRFPLRLVTALSQRFATYGLQFFKVNKTITHVAVARPHFLDTSMTPVSDGVRRIVEFVDATPNCTRRKLLDALAPSAASSVPPAQPSAGSVAAPPPDAAPTPEQTAVVGDLHWLIHEGHVLEFSNGVMETAKRPFPRPTPPEVLPVAPAPVDSSGASGSNAAKKRDNAEPHSLAAPSEAGVLAAETIDQASPNQLPQNPAPVPEGT